MIISKGKKKGMVHTRDITLDDVRAVFFPQDFHEKYRYLGAVPGSRSKLFDAIEPIVVFMDYKSKPKLCPRWFLRLLYLFGCDNSLVRVRSHRLSKLFRKLTRGYMIWDFKTKWYDYDLRISISGDSQCQELVSAVSDRFYREGYKADLVDQIRELDPNTKYNTGYSTDTLKEALSELELKTEE